MGYVTADTSMFYFCHNKSGHCTDLSIRTRSLCLAVLYQFFRETACDTRDTAEDAKDGMQTLPVRLGKTNTLYLMASMGILLDALFTEAISVSWSGLQLDVPSLMTSFVRVSITIGVYSKILQYPRGDRLAWGGMSLLGLLPVLWAQSTLLG